jgi:hypothetical protein
MKYSIRYHAATYTGIRIVYADDPDEAIAKTRAAIRKQMTLPMYSDSYRIVSEEEEDIDND